MKNSFLKSTLLLKSKQYIFTFISQKFEVNNLNYCRACSKALKLISLSTNCTCWYIFLPRFIFWKHCHLKGKVGLTFLLNISGQCNAKLVCNFFMLLWWRGISLNENCKYFKCAYISKHFLCCMEKSIMTQGSNDLKMIA